MVSHICLISLFGLLFRSLNALPARNDHNVPLGSPIASPGLKDTDQLCEWLYDRWAAAVPNNHLRKNKAGETLPALVSYSAVISQRHNGLSAYCRDNRKKSVLDAALAADPNERRNDGDYILACSSDEEAAVQRIPDPVSRYRVRGICRPLLNEPVDQSVRVPAGSTSCLDAEAIAALNRLDAYMMADEDDDGETSYVVPAPFTRFMSISERGTTRSVHVEYKNSISMTIDHTRSATYRVCAKQLAGHGNAILRLVFV